MKNLVFTSAGYREYRDKNNNPIEGNSIDRWTEGLKDFDLVTYCYDDSEIGKDKSNLWLNRPKFTKYQNFWHYASFYPEHLRQYDYIWVTDDDMFMSTEDINTMFGMMEEYDIDLGQPSFDLNGVHYIHNLVNDPDYILRYTDYIETSALLFHKDALKKIIRTFSETITGWGWDALISAMILEDGGRLAVFDKVKAYHAPSLSTLNKVLFRHGHSIEGTKLLEKYDRLDLRRKHPVIKRGIDLTGKEVPIRKYKSVAKERVVIHPILGETVTWEPKIKPYPSYQWRQDNETNRRN